MLIFGLLFEGNVVGERFWSSPLE